MQRLRRLQQTIVQQRDQIARHNNYLLNEQRVAKAVFDRVAHSGCLDAPNIRYLQSPYALFNGDLLLAAYRPQGIPICCSPTLPATVCLRRLVPCLWPRCSTA